MTAERYWEGRWRDEYAENQRLLDVIMGLRALNAEMLEALQGIVEVAEDNYADQPWKAIDKARAILANSDRSTSAQVRDR